MVVPRAIRTAPRVFSVKVRLTMVRSAVLRFWPSFHDTRFFSLSSRLPSLPEGDGPLRNGQFGGVGISEPA